MAGVVTTTVVCCCAPDAVSKQEISIVKCSAASAARKDGIGRAAEHRNMRRPADYCQSLFILEKKSTTRTNRNSFTPRAKRKRNKTPNGMQYHSEKITHTLNQGTTYLKNYKPVGHKLHKGLHRLRYYWQKLVLILEFLLHSFNRTLNGKCKSIQHTRISVCTVWKEKVISPSVIHNSGAAFACFEGIHMIPECYRSAMQQQYWLCRCYKGSTHVRPPPPSPTDVYWQRRA